MRTPIRITDIRPTTVTVPLEGALRHANGCHWGRFVRTIVEIDTDAGITGLGEMGGGGESSEASFRALKNHLVGQDPFAFEALRFIIANPTASLYNNRLQLLAAIEFACLDIAGQALDVPVYVLLGGKVREAVPFASYLFFRFASDATGRNEVRTIDQLVSEARTLKARHGFTSHKLKGGVFPPAHELACYRALSESLPGDSLRYDPNAVFSLEEATRFGRAIVDLPNDYYEDPTWGLNGMRQVRAAVPIRLATNTVVVNFEQLASNLRDPAVDVILLDTTFWGGIRPCVKAAGVCETVQTGIAVHSSGELGIQLATMLHLGAVLPNLTYAADAHYHHLTDDVIEGGKLKYENGAIRVPVGPGLGVRLDREKLEQYSDLYRRLGGYPYDRDPARPGWFATVPNSSWADSESPFWFDGTAAHALQRYS
jgi:glucarate dehydratase